MATFRWGTVKNFHGLLGVTLSVFREENFKQKYESILDEIFQLHGIPRGDRVYKGADIYRMFYRRPRIADSFIFKTSQKIASLENIRINAFCTTFDIGMQMGALLEAEGKDPTDESIIDGYSKKVMPIYDISSGKELITVSEFLNKIEGVYPAICAWKLTQVTSIRNQHFLLDNLEGEQSKAWDNLVSENHVELVPKGDQCNAYISATDILLRCIDSILERKALRLNKDNMKDVLGVIAGKGGCQDLIHVHSIWNPDIEMIRPIAPKSIHPEFFIKHPTIFIYNEKMGEIGQKIERVEFENSPLMNKLFEFAYSQGGGITFYDSDISTRIIRNGDYFVSYGDRGKKKFKELKNLRYPLIHYEITETE